MLPQQLPMPPAIPATMEVQQGMWQMVPLRLHGHGIPLQCKQHRLPQVWLPVHILYV